jgi:serine/threonine-protein kinase HipA
MKQLFAYNEGKRIGTLTVDAENTYSFEYDESWDEFDLSLSMPISQKKFGNKITLSFFENLLPEGEAKRTIEFHKKIKTVYDFLDSFGQDLAGAIIVTESENVRLPGNPNEKSEMDMAEIYLAIEEKRSVIEVLSDLNPGYLSLAGAQDKFPAIYENGKFYLPKNGGATTHIVKVPIVRSGIIGSVYNEYFCMKLASAVGLNIPNCFIVEGSDNNPLYVIERYDRIISKEKVTRIHQQDFCQALGFLSSNKYEHNGGPSFKDCYELLLLETDPNKRYQFASQLLDWLCFNLLIGNNDAHAKNISLLFENKKIALAPFYDLLSTEIYAKLKRELSFQIGDRSLGINIGKNQFNLLEKNLGIKENALVKRMLELTEKILEKKDRLLKEITKEFKGASVVKKIDDFILNRIKSLKIQGIS